MRNWPLVLITVLTHAATAQNSAKPGTGTVTGHVYLADTNTPARVASVLLEPVKDAEDRAADHPQQRFAPASAPAGGIVQTGFDGGFTFSNVPSGSYYVVAEAAGYLSPRANAADFDDAEPQPSAGLPPLIIPKVDIEADQPANIDIRLERGASVSGTVHFDDGSPAPGVTLVLLHKKKDKWVSSEFTSFVMTRNPQTTDDLGHYRISGLRDREYVVEAVLERVDLLFRGTHSTDLRPIDRTSLRIYSGDTPHIRDAVPFKLSAGEERTGVDITIPLSKLHTVGGVVIAASDGHPINNAFVQIANLDDKESITSAQVGSDGVFRIESVPEGTYLLRVADASDTQSREVSVGGEHHITFSDSKTVHQYGDIEQPIKVEGDIPNLILAVPEPKRQTPKNASQ